MGGCNGYFRRGNDKSPEEYYGRLNEYQKLIDAIDEGNNIIVLRGFRRVGKSSFMNFTFKQFEMVGGIKYKLIDCKLKYTKHSVEADINKVLNKQSETLDTSIKTLEELLSRIPNPKTQVASGIINVLKKIITTRWKQTEDILSKLKDEKQLLFIGLDEVQNFKDRKWLINFLNTVIDDMPNVFVIMSGSQVHTLNKFLELDENGTTVLKEDPEIIDMNVFTKKQAKEFLEIGFLQNDILIDKKYIDKIYQNVGGIPGWLRRAGCNIVKNYHKYTDINELVEVGISSALNKASREIKEEVQNLDKHAPRLMKKIAERKSMRIEEINKIAGIQKETTESIVHYLMDFGYLSFDGEKYYISDKVIQRIIMGRKNVR